MNDFKTIYKEKSLIVELGSITKLSDIALIDFAKLHGKSIDQFEVNQHIEKKHVMRTFWLIGCTNTSCHLLLATN